MMTESKTVYVLDDGSWQAEFLIQELGKNKKKTVEKANVSGKGSLKDGELEGQKHIDIDKYLSSLPKEKLDQGATIWLHFVKEDYMKKDKDDTEQEPGLDLHSQLLKARGKYPNLKIHYGYQFHDREKLRAIMKFVNEESQKEVKAKDVTEMDAAKLTDYQIPTPSTGSNEEAVKMLKEEEAKKENKKGKNAKKTRKD